jgi:general secretion pathway protein E
MPTPNGPAKLSLASGISGDFLRYHRLCPLAEAPDGTLIVAATEGAMDSGIDDLSIAYGRSVVTTHVSAEELERLIAGLTIDSDRAIELAAPATGEQDDVTADVRDLANQPPVVRYVNLLVRDAYDSKASDIHLEATRDGLTARFRLDGVLSPSAEPPPRLQHAVVSRIKLLAELDIAERRRPQDGRIRVRLEERELDIRVSTVPTMFGESVVLRLLDQGGHAVSLGELGMAPEMLADFSRLVDRPHGMVLVTGPTGSGKTTTLYAALGRRSPLAEKIITVEDPVEYEIDHITQVPVHRTAGVTFATALRAILRQDPDVVMVGEMRDAETAAIAVQAAMTGHLVFSTLHTNDAVGAVARLLDLGVPDYLVTATVEGILAQRLVRRICDTCRVSYDPDADAVASLASRPVGRVKLTRGAGCSACRGTGFRGRVGLFELLPMRDDLRDAVTAHLPRTQLRSLALDGGMVPLRADGWSKVRAGLTTVEEVLRVVQL